MSCRASIRSSTGTQPSTPRRHSGSVYGPEVSYSWLGMLPPFAVGRACVRKADFTHQHPNTGLRPFSMHLLREGGKGWWWSIARWKAWRRDHSVNRFIHGVEFSRRR